MTPRALREEETFADRAAFAFAPMATFGFRETSREHESVRFESAVLFVSVRLGRGSRHLSVELGRRRERGAFSLHEVLEALAPTETSVARLQATSVVAQRHGLERIVDVILRRLAPLSAGDPEPFARMAVAVAAARRRATLAATHGPTLEAGDAAWAAKDRAAALAAYARGRAAIDETRLRRLRYLEARARRSGGTAQS